MVVAAGASSIRLRRQRSPSMAALMMARSEGRGAMAPARLEKGLGDCAAHRHSVLERRERRRGDGMVFVPPLAGCRRGALVIIFYGVRETRGAEAATLLSHSLVREHSGCVILWILGIGLL